MLAPTRVWEPGWHAERAQPMAEEVSHEDGSMLPHSAKEEQPHCDVPCRAFGAGRWPRRALRTPEPRPTWGGYPAGLAPLCFRRSLTCLPARVAAHLPRGGCINLTVPLGKMFRMAVFTSSTSAAVAKFKPRVTHGVCFLDACSVALWESWPLPIAGLPHATDHASGYGCLCCIQLEEAWGSRGNTRRVPSWLLLAVLASWVGAARGCRRASGPAWAVPTVKPPDKHARRGLRGNMRRHHAHGEPCCLMCVLVSTPLACSAWPVGPAVPSLSASSSRACCTSCQVDCGRPPLDCPSPGRQALSAACQFHCRPSPSLRRSPGSLLQLASAAAEPHNCSWLRLGRVLESCVGQVQHCQHDFIFCLLPMHGANLRHGQRPCKGPAAKTKKKYIYMCIDIYKILAYTYLSMSIYICCRVKNWSNFCLF